MFLPLKSCLVRALFSDTESTFFVNLLLVATLERGDSTVLSTSNKLRRSEIVSNKAKSTLVSLSWVTHANCPFDRGRRGHPNVLCVSKHLLLSQDLPVPGGLRGSGLFGMVGMKRLLKAGRTRMYRRRESLALCGEGERGL